MASIVSDPNGRKRIMFQGLDGRQGISLGKMSKSQAEAVKVRVEHLLTAKITGTPVDGETSRWLVALGDKLYGRLAAAGLATERQSQRLGEWLEKYLNARDVDRGQSGEKGLLKPESYRKLSQTVAKLLAFFGVDVPVRALNPDRAKDWRQWLAGQKLSVAAIRTHCGNAKTIFAEAVRKKLVEESPFADLRSGTTAAVNDRYITPDESEAIIAALPDAEWRLLFALARHAGLRVPSESHLLTWADVDWARGRLNVRSPKTERHRGKERRSVPITPRLMKLLQDRFDAAGEGKGCLVTMRGSGHVRGVVAAAIKAAGVEPWPRMFQACRASCEQEWAMTYPQYAVSRWIGHSMAVSDKHYANNVPDELFDRATGVRRGVQQIEENPGNAPQTKNPAGAGHLHISATGSELTQVVAEYELGGGGNRTPVPR